MSELFQRGGSFRSDKIDVKGLPSKWSFIQEKLNITPEFVEGYY